MNFTLDESHSTASNQTELPQKTFSNLLVSPDIRDPSFSPVSSSSSIPDSNDFPMRGNYHMEGYHSSIGRARGDSSASLSSYDSPYLMHHSGLSMDSRNSVAYTHLKQELEESKHKNHGLHQQNQQLIQQNSMLCTQVTSLQKNIDTLMSCIANQTAVTHDTENTPATSQTSPLKLPANVDEELDRKLFEAKFDDEGSVVRPGPRFWTRHQWNTRIKGIPSVDDDDDTGTGQRGPSRLAQNLNVSCRYIEDELGEPVTGERAGQMRNTNRSFFETLKNRSTPVPETWSKVPLAIKTTFWNAMRTQYIELRFCEGNWKIEKLATNNYSQWYGYHVGRTKLNKVKNEDGTNAPISNKRAITSEKDIKADPGAITPSNSGPTSSPSSPQRVKRQKLDITEEDITSTASFVIPEDPVNVPDDASLNDNDVSAPNTNAASASNGTTAANDASAANVSVSTVAIPAIPIKDIPIKDTLITSTLDTNTIRNEDNVARGDTDSATEIASSTTIDPLADALQVVPPTTTFTRRAQAIDELSEDSAGDTSKVGESTIPAARKELVIVVPVIRNPLKDFRISSTFQTPFITKPLITLPTASSSSTAPIPAIVVPPTPTDSLSTIATNGPKAINIPKVIITKTTPKAAAPKILKPGAKRGPSTLPMRPTRTICPRNSCARDLLLRAPKTTASEFSVHWAGLSAEEKAVFELQAKEERLRESAPNAEAGPSSAGGSEKAG